MNHVFFEMFLIKLHENVSTTAVTCDKNPLNQESNDVTGNPSGHE